MNSTTGSATTGIPLHCNICPKKPDFSDTSHLLTHIASKQHLSNYYKMKVRATGDMSAKRDIDAYDRWYEEWNLNDMMMERMSQKEKRSRGAGGGRKASVASSSRSTPSAAARPAPRREPSLRENVLDPQLGHRIKIEPMSRPSSPHLMPQLDLGALHRTYGPPMQGWPTTPYGHSPTPYGTSNGYMSDGDEDYDPTYGGPRRLPHHRYSDEAGSWQGSLAESLQSSLLRGDEMALDEAPNEATRLKGDIWPGMAMFDSATPNMRRKRNQKKSISVLELLQATSETIEPAEFVFDPDVNRLKTRVITGEPTSDSPVRGETSPEPDSPPAKKKNTRRPKGSRQALAERDVNSGRTLRNRRPAAHHQPQRSGRMPYYDGSDDLDDDMTYVQRPKRRTGLSIHRDNTGPDITFDGPGSRLSALSAGLHDPFQNNHTYGRSNQPQLSRNSSHLSNNSYQPQQPQTYRHQSRSSLGGFRPSEQHGLPPRDLSAFGALTTQSVYTAGTDFGSMLSGAQTLNAFHQQFHPASSHASNIPPFLQDANMHMQHQDIFGGYPAHDTSAFAPLDMNFGNNETAANPLFCDNGLTGPIAVEDEERTISAPQSERSRD